MYEDSLNYFDERFDFPQNQSPLELVLGLVRAHIVLNLLRQLLQKPTHDAHSSGHTVRVSSALSN